MLNALPISERNLVLTGSTGPGLPVLGRSIAARLGMPFVSLEALIAERVDLPPGEIRAYYGETRLKAIEAELVQETCLRRSSVIYVSGRTLLQADHMIRFQETGPVICLVIGLDAMLAKLHLSLGARYHDPNTRALALGDLKREWSVRGLPGLHEIDTTGIDDDAIIAQTAALWQSLAIERA